MKIYEADAVVVKKEEVVGNISVNQVIRQGYFLLGLTILFSALTAFLTMYGFLPFISKGFLGIVLMFGSLWLAQANSNSKMGLVFTFVFTGLMGNYVAPIITYYLSNFANGFGLVMGSLLGTAGIFISLSAYVWISKKNFTFLYGILGIGLFTVMIVSILSLLFNLSFMESMVSAAMVIITSGLILADTSLAIRGGVRDPVLLAVNLYVDILNLFLHLLRILSIFAGREK